MGEDMQRLTGAADKPLYIQIRDAVKEQIRQGELRAGDKIPSEVMLQKTFNVSRVTVRKAVEELVRDNYLIKLQGRGTYVSQVLEFENKKGVSSFTQLCRLQGKASIARVIKADLVRGDKGQCGFFNVNAGSWLMCVERVRRVDGLPVVLETNYFHPFCEFLKNEDLTGSVYEILTSKYHIYPAKRGLNEVGIVSAGGREAELLDIKEGLPVLTSRVQVYDSKDNPVHEVQQIVRVDRPEVFKYYID